MYHAMWMGHPLHSNLLLPWQSASHADPCIDCCIPGKAPAMQTHCPKDGAKQPRIIFLIKVTVTTANLRYTAACVPFQYRTLLENTHHHSAQTKICACCSSAADVHSLQAAQCRLLALLTTQVCPFTGYKQFPQTKLRTSAACAALTYGSKIYIQTVLCVRVKSTHIGPSPASQFHPAAAYFLPYWAVTSTTPCLSLCHSHPVRRTSLRVTSILPGCQWDRHSCDHAQK